MKDGLKRSPKTAAELMAELRQDPALRERERARQQEQDTHAKGYREAAGGILEDLRRAGFNVSTVGELRMQRRYKKAISILVNWLGRVTDLQVKKDIIRTLSVPWAKSEVGPALVAEYRRSDDSGGSGVRWAIANALEVVASEEIFEDLVEFARQQGAGQARQMLVLAIANTKARSAPDVLLKMLGDEEIAGHAVSGLASLKATVPRAAIQPFLRHPAAWVCKDAVVLIEICCDERT